MDDGPNDDAFDAFVERFAAALVNDGVAGGTLGPNGMTLGMPNWEERTKDQRYSEKARTHGYPLGLSKSARFLCRQRVAEIRDRVLTMSEQERLVFAAAFEALAYAIDAERFSGSFNMRGHNSFPVEAVDGIAESIVVWLAERGHRIVAMDAPEAQSAGDLNQPAQHSGARPPRRQPPDDEKVEKLSEPPWDSDAAIVEADARLVERYTQWNRKSYTRKQQEGGFYNFIFVPAKLRRQDVIERYRAKLLLLRGEDRLTYRASHEALAYAVDAELFLQSVPSLDLEGDAMEDAVNRFTNRLMAWLDEAGYQLVPKPSGPAFSPA